MSNETHLSSEDSQETSLIDLISSTTFELASLSIEAQEYLMALIEEGTLEQYQTEGTIKKWTIDLLQKLHERGEQDTS